MSANRSRLYWWAVTIGVVGLWLAFGLFLTQAINQVRLVGSTFWTAVSTGSFGVIIQSPTFRYDLLVIIVTMIIAVSAIGTGTILVRSSRDARRVRRLVQTQQIPTPATVEAIRARHQLSAPIAVITSPTYVAMTAGFWRPTIVVSDHVVQSLPLDQLEAILLHENAHVLQRDPVRLLLLRLVTAGWQRLVPVRRFITALTVDAEVQADQAAIQVMGSRRPLLAAILQLMNHQPATVESAAGFSVTSERIERLLADHRSADPDWSVRSFFLGLGTIIAITVLASSSVVLSKCSQPIFCLVKTANAATNQPINQSPSVVGNAALCADHHLTPVDGNMSRPR